MEEWRSPTLGPTVESLRRGVVSTKGNRSNTNQTRITGKRDEPHQPGGSSASGGSHQESLGHHKHNNPGQGGHKPQRHTPDQEKH